MQRELLERQSQVLRGLEEDIRSRDDEINKLKEELSSKSSASKRLEKQLKNQKEINTKIVRNKDDNLVINNIKMSYEKQLGNLNKEVNFFMNKAE
jgi:predicted RNase H-like nuclease (RuvC/YqgF family)